MIRMTGNEDDHPKGLRSDELEEYRGDIWKRLVNLIEKDDSPKEVNSLLELLGKDVDLDTKIEYLFPSNDVDTDDVTLLMLAVGWNRLQTTRLLLEKGADIMAETSDYRATALIYAVWQNVSLDLIEVLVEKGHHALMEKRDKQGCSALAFAAQLGHKELVQILIEKGANIGSMKGDPYNGLHLAVLTQNNDLVDIFLAAIHEQDSEMIEAGMRLKWLIENWRAQTIFAKNHYGSTPLDDAARKSYYYGVLKILDASWLAFESFPRADPYISNDNEAGSVANCILSWMAQQDLREHESAAIKPNGWLGHENAIFFWAILHTNDAVFDNCLADSKPLPSESDSFSWISIAAFKATYGMTGKLLERIQELSIELTRDLLRLAIKHSNVQFARAIIDRASELTKKMEHSDTSGLEDQTAIRSNKDIVKILIERSKGEDLISLSAKGGKPGRNEIELLLWKTLDHALKDLHELFSSSQSDHLNYIFELAAQFEPPGHEKYLSKYLEKFHNTQLSTKLLGASVLLKAVFLQLPVVVWWVLSHGSYTGEREIKEALQLLEDMTDGNMTIDGVTSHESCASTTDVNSEKNIIKELLSDPPPILKSRAPWDDLHQPHLEPLPSDFNSPNGTVVDLFHVRDIIYDGPQKIMRPCKYDKILKLKDDLKKFEISSNIEQNSPAAAFSGFKGPDMRWIHIPINDFTCMKETYMHEQGEKREAKESRKEKQEIPFKSSAIYMPYLSCSECPRTTANTGPDNSDSCHESFDSKWEIKYSVSLEDSKDREHSSMTLDQYYYSSITDTRDRDKDQVVGRFTRSGTSQRRFYDLEEFIHRVEDDGNSSDQPDKIIVVNQLWLWIIDEKTLITSTTRENDVFPENFRQRVESKIKSHGDTCSWSAEFLQELILSTATGMFHNVEIPIGSLQETPDERIKSLNDSPLGIFRKSIQEVRDREAKLFLEFSKKLVEDKKNEQASIYDQDKGSGLVSYMKASYYFISGRKANLSNKVKRERETRSSSPTYDDIIDETGLLRVIKDICDELNILKCITRAQDDVFKQLRGENYNKQVEFTYNSPSSIHAEIVEMMQDVDFVQKSIHLLLDLKQKQANIFEAKNSRKQSEETAKQGVAIMVFTLVTIVFLPASFLTSLFALNVSDFPHNGDNVSYEGRWIFPIIYSRQPGRSPYNMEPPE
ncbi:hypothetical protein N7495_007608 [Penicillium taxi]|uniref:uncharacterized protein n=1 Tax=Penicillium taxi TaxID=168475 RepID=UPI0025455C5C|nr:uncharacterized protein N7495_007608 [Penicillium taxi]KAJ5887567.1 hypothetical protein N7495_007608 [Penicillium taxi]